MRTEKCARSLCISFITESDVATMTNRINNKRVCAIILAAGMGSRMKSTTPKQNMQLCGMTVAERSVAAFSQSELISSIIVVTRAEDVIALDAKLKDKFTKRITVIAGGTTRQESASLGFKAVSDTADYVAIHDAARCLITPSMIDRVVSAAFKHGCATAGTMCTDTVKLISDGFVEKTVPRDNLFLAQTPQVFRCDLYTKAIRASADNVTDDNMLLESIGEKVYCVDTGKENIKITSSQDLLYAEFLLGTFAGNEGR